MKRDELEKRVLEIISERLSYFSDVDKIHINGDTTFKDLSDDYGLDSLDKIEIIVYIENGLAVDIPDWIAECDTTSVNSICDFLIESNQV